MRSFSFTIRGHKYDVELKSLEESEAEIEVNGTLYQVEIHKQLQKQKTPTLVRSAVPPPSRGDRKIKKNISQTGLMVKSPLPGNIIQLFVKEGDQVSKGQKLLLYEAMKMENEILAEKEGTIKTIKVQPGDSVLEGDVLMEIV